MTGSEPAARTTDPVDRAGDGAGAGTGDEGTHPAPRVVHTDPANDHPVPEEAREVAASTEFGDAVAVALMRVVLDGAGSSGEAAAHLARQVVANPRREAERFAVALATDPAIVAATLAPDARTDPTGLAQLCAKVAAIWPVMAGEMGPQVVDHRDQRSTGKG